MKRLLLLFLTIFLFSASQAQKSTHKVLNPNRFEKKISKNKVLLIDVRTPEEFAAGHIKDAQNIDFLQDDFKSHMQEFNKKKPIYIYCRSGKRSKKAAEQLSEMGFRKIYELEGGIQNWQKNQAK